MDAGDAVEVEGSIAASEPVCAAEATAKSAADWCPAMPLSLCTPLRAVCTACYPILRAKLLQEAPHYYPAAKIGAPLTFANGYDGVFVYSVAV